MVTEQIIKNSGFTLIEFVITITITGIIFAITSLFIANPIRAYTSIATTAELVDAAEMSMQRMARDIRNAVPNSIRVKTVAGAAALEMMNAVEAVRYRGTGPGTASQILTFDTAQTDFDIIGNFQVAALGASNYRLAIYNIGATDSGGTDFPTNGLNVYASSGAAGPFPVAGSNVITPTSTVVTLSTAHINMNPAFNFALPSPQNRLYLISGPITYLCSTSTNNITRYTGYIANSVQPTNATLTPLNSATNVALLANNISACSFAYQAGTSARNGIVTISLTLTNNGETINLLQQVSVSNVP